MEQEATYTKLIRRFIEMGILRNIFLKAASEETLRKKGGKLQRNLDKLDYDSKKYGRAYEKHSNYVSAINSKSTGKLPKREHGWYVSKKD